MAPSAYKNKKQPLLQKYGGRIKHEIDVYEKGNQPLYPFLMFFLT